MQKEEKTTEKTEEKKDIRNDGYKNLMNKYGTKQDSSEQYRFVSDEPVADIELEINYEENGIFAKIIDIPADDAVRSGFDYGITDADIIAFIDDMLDDLEFKAKSAEAIKYARIFGGSLMVMFIDDGKELDQPIDWNNIRGIDDLQVFERPHITPDYSSIYKSSQIDGNTNRKSKFGMPEYYEISYPYGGTFRVHESRCLPFRNNKMPMYSQRTEYRFFGIPEYVRIHRELQVTTTSHGNGAKLLDRAVQAIYKMQGLAERILTDDGEDEILKRLNLIDMAKGIMSSIAIDAEGEDYRYETVSFAGVKEIIDSACNMLSAVTNIPQTKLFGRSPAGENSTGESDMENYYNYVGNIQEANLKNNTKTVIDIILIAGKYSGAFEEIPKYKLKFKPLWNLNEKEQADVDKTKADTEYVKAQTAQVYVDMQALDADEVRKRLAEEGEFTVNDILSEEEEWPEITSPSAVEAPEMEAPGEEATANPAEDQNADEEPAPMCGCQIMPTGCGVIVIRDGKVLIGNRKDNGLICGPGGHIEVGETAEEAAIRETREEFGINIAETIPVTVLTEMPAEYCPSQVFLCTEFYGEPLSFNEEMQDARFVEISDVLKEDLFLPFRLGLEELMRQIDECLLTADNTSSNIKAEADGGPGSGRKPEGGTKEKQGQSKRKKASLPMTEKEIAKVGHDINNVFHTKYKGKRSCYIKTRSNEPDSPVYVYRFRNHGFDNYEIYMKESDD